MVLPDQTPLILLLVLSNEIIHFLKQELSLHHTTRSHATGFLSAETRLIPRTCSRFLFFYLTSSPTHIKDNKQTKTSKNKNKNVGLASQVSLSHRAYNGFLLGGVRRRRAWCNLILLLKNISPPSPLPCYHILFIKRRKGNMAVVLLLSHQPALSTTRRRLAVLKEGY